MFPLSLTLQQRTLISFHVTTYVDVPVVAGRNKVPTTHSGTWQPVQSVHFLNKHHLFGGCLVLLHLPIPRLLTLRPQLMHFVHCPPAPHLQRLPSRRWSVALQTCRVENTVVARRPLCALVTLMTDTHRSTGLHPTTVCNLLCCL